MRLEKVCITNFKSIKKKTLEFQKGFNLIIGENGTGKTSILEAIAVGLGGFITGIKDVSTRQFSNDEMRCVYSKIGDGSYNRIYETPIEVECEGIFDKNIYPQEIVTKESYTWKRSKSDRTATQPKEISNIAKELANAVDTPVLPVICFQGAGRVWTQKKEKEQNPFAEQYFRTIGYLDCLTEESNIKMLQNWCLKMEHISWTKNQRIAEYEAVKNAVADFMQHMEQDDSKYAVFYDRQYEMLMFQKDGTLQSISSLSAGYQSLIWMVFDIAYRMAVLNPQLKERITADTSGVVLIDEIDLHLHPKWQWNIVEALTQVFPNVQFIATTHSPIVIAAARNTWLIDIAMDTGTWKSYGLNVNETLKIYQDSQELPSELVQQEAVFYALLEQQKYDEARIVLEQMEHDLGENIPLTVGMRTTYELETALLED